MFRYVKFLYELLLWACVRLFVGFVLVLLWVFVILFLLIECLIAWVSGFYVVELDFAGLFGLYSYLDNPFWVW